MKTIIYELKSLNTFVKQSFITQIDKTLGPVIIKVFSYDYKRKHKKKQKLKDYRKKQKLKNFLLDN